ncbi:hypothetical protein NM208_g207 [Fusarium decemcellulare]|uniref:Uncharacterized protein n=1 Tax=Fusarium decemcellulare TaxID=57161 RepID=A0ACC1T112_9HYPO|nr:hypothetical protein NM208_g207 [Fusarium decemcellulare]
MSLFDKWLAVASIFSTLSVLYFAGTIAYNLFLHPLRKFPGPLLMRATRWPYLYKVVAGTLPFDMLDLHNQYGDVVRVAPNELAFFDEKTWKDIMGHRTQGRSEFAKPLFFYNPTNGPTNIVSSTGPEHAMLRRQLAPGFSEKSLRSQQPIIMRYIDLLMLRLHERCKYGNVDLMSWYNFTTFDIIGDLTFGESFQCLEKSDYNPWVRNIFALVKVNCVMQQCAHFPWLRKLLANILSSPVARSQQSCHRESTRHKLLRRIELGKNQERPDLIEGLLKKKDEWNISTSYITKNAGVLIVAGSESSATGLSGITYLLAKNPESLRKLTEEIRSSFDSEEEIDFVSVNKLTYLMACVDEGMRMYPPVPCGFPRIAPNEGATVSGHFVPKDTIVAIHQWATYHSERNFKKPSEFHPERFLGDPEFELDRRDALQPFHIGPRGCLGRNLAYVEMKVILARLIWNFNFTLAPESNQWMESQKIYNLWEKGPMMFKLEPFNHVLALSFGVLFCDGIGAVVIPGLAAPKISLTRPQSDVAKPQDKVRLSDPQSDTGFVKPNTKANTGSGDQFSKPFFRIGTPKQQTD